MSENMKPEKPEKPPAAPKGEPPREGIKIKELRFCRPNGLEIPVPGGDRVRFDMRSSIVANDKNADNGTTEIVFEPWQRRYRITYSGGNAKRTVTFSIHETWALHLE